MRKKENDLRIGFHSLESIIINNPHKIKKVFLPANRDDTRINDLIKLMEKNEIEFKKLVDMLYECQRTVYQQEHYESEPVLGNMWANINPPGGMNRAHQHPNSLWSGVYYIKAPNKSGDLKIDDPRASAAMYRPRQKEGPVPERLFRETHYEPVAGRCIMFPSWLMHCVDPNESNDIRISVSFNFLQKGMFV